MDIREKIRKRRKRRIIRRIIYSMIFMASVIAVMLIIGASKPSPEDPGQTTVSESGLPQRQQAIQQTAEQIQNQIPEPGEITFAEIERDTGLPLVVIDPGIGRPDDGDIESVLLAEQINAGIAARLRQKLTDMGCQVLTAAEEDLRLTADYGVRMANHYQADFYIGLRQVTEPLSEMNGVQTWYNGKDESGNSRKLAQQIQQAVIRNTQVWDRDLKDNPFFSSSETPGMPACIIETGNSSKEKDREILTGEIFQEKLAVSVAEGIESYVNPKVIYLTFDDGPSTTYTNQVLDILKAKDIKATFFVVGENVRKNPETARRIVAEGHAIGIHCNWHDYSRVYESIDSYLADFEAAYQIVLETTGVETRLFRFPGGSLSIHNREHLAGLIEEMENRGYIYYDWNVSIDDTVNNTEPEQLIENAVSGVRDRSKVILLAHDIVPKTVSCLDELLNELAAQYPEYRMEVLTPEVEPVQFRR